MNACKLALPYNFGHSEFMAAHAKGPLTLRLWETLPVNATDPASATKAAALIGRSRPNQFDGQFGTLGLAETLDWPFFDRVPARSRGRPRIMNEYGKLAIVAARGGWHVQGHVIDNSAVTDLLDTWERVNKNQGMDHLRGTMSHV